MTGKLIYLGDDPMRAASFKLFGNLFIITMMAGLADMNRLAGAVGISTEDAFSIFSWFNPAPMIPGRAKTIAAQTSRPRSNLPMARKDVRLMIEEAKRHGVDLGVLPAVAACKNAAIAKATARSIRAQSLNWMDAHDSVHHRRRGRGTLDVATHDRLARVRPRAHSTPVPHP